MLGPIFVFLAEENTSSLPYLVADPSTPTDFCEQKNSEVSTESFAGTLT